MPKQKYQPLEPWIAKLKEKGSTPLPHRRGVELGDDLNAVWAHIEQTLDAKLGASVDEVSAKDNTSVTGKNRRRIIPFRRYMSVAATALLLVGLGITFFTLSDRAGNKPLQEGGTIASNTPQGGGNSEKGSAIAVEKATCDVIAQAHPKTSAGIPNLGERTTAYKKAPRAISTRTNREKAVSEDEIRSASSTKESLDMQPTPFVPSEKAEQDTQEKDAEVTVEMPNKRPTRIKEDSRELLALGELTFASHATYSTGGSNNIKSNDGLRLMSNNPFYPNFEPFGEDSPLLYDKATFKHQYPISTGVMISIGIGKRFSVETGIRYALLRSTVSDYLPDKTIVQRVHYIGVPLGFNFEIYRYKALSVYSGASFSVDKAIGSFLGSRNLEINPLQLSISGHAGISYSVVPAIAIYLEPGISYYFDDNSQLKTYYKQTPLNFSISMGIRFTPSFNW